MKRFKKNGYSCSSVTWMLHFDIEGCANVQTWKVSVNCENNTFYETFGNNY